jgi:sugar lactone lactonase YvrE
MKRFGAVVFLLAFAACNNPGGPQPPHTAISDKDRRNNIIAPPVVIEVSKDLAGPESALYDPDQDVYFISNINGSLLDTDNGGFITRIDAKTLQVNAKWIEGGKNNVHLDAAKGMAIIGDSLYVADTKAVRKFDRRSGAVQGSIELPGATTINDLATDGKRVFASDTGVIPGPGETFEATGTDAIWVIENDRARKIASGHDTLKQPNGLFWSDGKLWVVTFGGNELYSLDGDRKGNVMEMPKAQLDGVVRTSDGSFLVTSWVGMAVYRGKASDEFEPILQSVMMPADIGYDSKRHLLMVPSSAYNRVTFHPVR